MMRISSSGLVGIDRTIQNSLNQAFNQLNQSGTKLATLRRINRGSDDPAAMIAVEALRAELTALEQGDRNASRAAHSIHVADSGLGQVSSLLNNIRAAVLDSASLTTPEQLEANQIQIDAALEAIDRIGATSGLDGEALNFLFSADPADVITLENPEINAATVGGDAGVLADLATGGSASLSSGDFTRAVEILDAASSQVNTARAELGSFERFSLGASQRVNQAAQVNVSSAISQIADTDLASETARFVQARILVQSSLASVQIGNERRGLIANLLDAI